MGLRKTLGNVAFKMAAVISGGGSDQFMSLTNANLPGFLRGIGSMSPRLISLATRQDIARAWTQCPPIVAIICGKALADITGKVTFKYTDSEETVNLSKQPTARAMSRLMARPNPMQTWKQFRAQQKVFTQAMGFCPVLCIKPAGFTGPDSVKMMWNIPPQNTEIETTGKLFFQSGAEGIIKKIEVRSPGQTILLPIDDVMFIKDIYISLNTEILPESRITALEYPISNIITAYSAANVMLTKRGAMGILSSAAKDEGGTMPVTPKQRDALQEDWQRYGIGDELAQIIITSAALNWQQIALPVKELMLYEAIQDGTRSCCAVYNFPYEMLPAEKGVTFANRTAAKKSLYQDAVIPEADSDMEVYNEYFKLADKGIVMSLDYSHLEVFQTSEKDKAAALKGKAESADLMFRANAITLNRMREMLGENTVEGDDVYFHEWEGKPEPVNNQNVNQDEPEPTEAAA